MQKSFTYCSSHDLKGMFEIVEGMKKLLYAIDMKDIPNGSSFNTNDLLFYCKSLVKGQRNGIEGLKNGSWSVAPDINDMPADARVDFIYVPTYIAVAILSRVLLDYPWIAIQIPGYYRSLKTGLKFCTYRRLNGFGYDAINGAIDAFLILSIGRVPLLLEIAPNFSKDLRKTFKDFEEFLKDSLNTSETKGVWGEDYSIAFQSALETYYVSIDKDLMVSIKEEAGLGILECSKELES